MIQKENDMLRPIVWRISSAGPKLNFSGLLPIKTASNRLASGVGLSGSVPAASRHRFPKMIHQIRKKFDNTRAGWAYARAGGESPTDRRKAVRAALVWLCKSQDVTNCAGFSRAYSLLDGWGPPYPETTGYISQTFLNFEERFPELSLAERAGHALEWLASIQFDSGAICSLMYHPSNLHPSVFNTAMVLHGWLSWLETPDERIARAAESAANWLIAEQEETGLWVRNSYKRIPHSYYTMVDWALLRYFNLTADEKAKLAAKGHLQWALANQLPNGWIMHCAFETGEDPLTHNLSYATQGLVECGKILGDDRLLCAARKATVPMLEYFKKNLCLPGKFSESWAATVNWECVPGNSQTAIVWKELAKYYNEPEWLEWGEKLVQNTLKYQKTETSIDGINGGLPGSWPISGAYDAYSFTNHAAKFFADSLV